MRHTHLIDVFNPQRESGVELGAPEELLVYSSYSEDTLPYCCSAVHSYLRPYNALRGNLAAAFTLLRPPRPLHHLKALKPSIQSSKDTGKSQPRELTTFPSLSQTHSVQITVIVAANKNAHSSGNRHLPPSSAPG